MENRILKRVKESPHNITRMADLLHSKFDYNIATYKLNVYKTSTIQHQLYFS